MVNYRQLDRKEMTRWHEPTFSYIFVWKLSYLFALSEDDDFKHCVQKRRPKSRKMSTVRQENRF